MKLYDLIKSNDWPSVELALLRLYPVEIMVAQYKKVFEILKLTEPNDYEMEIVIKEFERDTDLENVKEKFYDVYGRKKDPDPYLGLTDYAIEFEEWKNWLGMDIAPETIKNFSEPEIIAHCLYEMTYIGFDQNGIREKFTALKERAEELENLTDEERKQQKIFSLDELKKRLDKKKKKRRKKRRN